MKKDYQKMKYQLNPEIKNNIKKGTKNIENFIKKFKKINIINVKKS